MSRSADLEALTRVYQALSGPLRQTGLMPDREEILRSLYGAWRLAASIESGMRYFTLTVDGFWRSFFAAVLVAPGYVILVARELIGRVDTFDLGWVVLVQVLAYALSWAAFPLAAVLLIRLFDLSGNYVALIVSLNWAAVIQVGAVPGGAAPRDGGAGSARWPAADHRHRFDPVLSVVRDPDRARIPRAVWLS